eukprot:TRINITY_DN28350_c0_g1_i2.p1 TRINITY_DN28350_c0_g1~~TRINITY_DN28350_c0_g1_i2.p1  ORF type:complete len:102 (+),score=6.97 TRINITY_DN28350_c0_g1_i2:302-607(+)
MDVSNRSAAQHTHHHQTKGQVSAGCPAPPVPASGVLYTLREGLSEFQHAASGTLDRSVLMAPLSCSAGAARPPAPCTPCTHSVLKSARKSCTNRNESASVV